MLSSGVSFKLPSPDCELWLVGAAMQSTRSNCLGPLPPLQKRRTCTPAVEIVLFV